ncbi:hypothetical protein LOTGIDRAFT_229132 [Lottia gigantea]|uniref:EF-hand domain-containing protein n=1 Tax=Lottia gigantea TaxID=225164 RepID=V4BKY0_LOTGI|nr:hypothetical protein LOTGIDRAFT_229132 [Lottia gigantea]ESO89244.1 hypothetical protein LOTGIDRAFT_229132 [Lottia gigantea]
MAKVPTLCEVSYDSAWNYDDNFYTPFRLPSANRSKHGNLGYGGRSSVVPLAVDERRPSFSCVGVLKSVDSAQDTYYEFLRDYYIEHSSSPLTFYSGRYSRGGTIPSPQLPPRPYSTVPTLPDSNYIAPIHYDSNPVTYPLSLPALSKLHHGEENPEASPYVDEKLIWVDTLNAWISEKKLKESKPYVSFINNPPYVEKLFTATEGRKIHKCLKCHRYEDHMYNYKRKLSACTCRRKPNIESELHRRAVLDRREKLRSESPSKRAQRKAYSTPLCNTHAQRKVQFVPLSARNDYVSRNVPSPSSPIPSLKDVKIVDGDSQKNVSFKDEKEEQYKDKITEVFGLDTHSSESDSEEIHEFVKQIIAEELENHFKETQPEHSDHSPSQIVVASDSSQSVITAISSVAVNIKTDAEKSKTKKEVPKLFVRRQQKAPTPAKTKQESSKQQLPNIPQKEETVKKAPPKKPAPEPIPIDYDEIREATARLMRKSIRISLYIKKEKDKATKVSRPAAPQQKPKDKLWKALPKFELKSSKSKKSGLKKKQDSAARIIFKNEEKSKTNITNPKEQDKVQIKSDPVPQEQEQQLKTTKQPKNRLKKQLSKQLIKQKSKQLDKQVQRQVHKMEKADVQVHDDVPITMISTISVPVPQIIKPLPLPPLPVVKGPVLTHGYTTKPKREIIKPQPLPVSLPEDLAITPPPVSVPTTPVDKSVDTQTDQPGTPPQSRRDTQSVEDGGDEEMSKKSRSPIKKKERVARDKHEVTEDNLPEGPDLSLRKQSSWIYGSNSGSEIDVQSGSPSRTIKFDPAALPTTPDVPTLTIDDKKRPLKTHVINKKLMPVTENKKRWGAKKFDTSYEDEQRRAELAERRRKKQMLMYEKLKLSKMGNTDIKEENGKNGASFGDYDFLSKYCIFAATNKDMLHHAFNTVDENGTGWIDCAGTMVALRSINNKLTYTEEEYLYRVMEMTGYNVSHGADFKLFSILAALSTRISLLDEWMKNIIGQMDFQTLEMKLFLCKTLWECNVNRETNTIPIEQLIIELRAGGVSYQHECQVRKKLSHLKALDLFDFLTYVPLFIMIHESVVDNPLNDTRNK